MKFTKLKAVLAAALCAVAGVFAYADDAAEETVVATAEAEFWLGGDEVVVASGEKEFVLGPALAVANVTTATHWPWDGKIDVTCDLTGSGNVRLSAALTTNGVKVCDATAANLTGATTINLDAAGGVTNGVKFTWNAKADCPAGFNSTDTKVKVTAEKVVPPAGALPGEFSVSADKKVLFSQGNLIATVDATGAPTAWKFATNQYDFLGEGGANLTIGSAAGDVDIFGWSSSATGTEPTDNYGIKDDHNVTKFRGAFYDWGNAIGDGKTWRTLTIAEWQYLLNTRSVNGGTGAGKSYSLNITYGEKTGVVLYPDNYTGSALSGTVETLPDGVVFLPAAGFRVNDGRKTYCSEYGDSGSYWAASLDESKPEDRACRVYLDDESAVFDTVPLMRGQSVRLVTDVPVTEESGNGTEQYKNNSNPDWFSK